MTFFSVVIPTKNRADIVRYAIQSVLRQTFEDFEIILVDNDDTDATNQATLQYRTDNRFKYFRTGNFSMADNWEYGISQAQGRYLTILEDKQILRRYALEYAHKHLGDEQYQVATFPYSNMETPKMHRAFFTRLVPGAGFLNFKPQHDIADQPFALSTREVIEDHLFSSDRISSLPFLPRGITSFTHLELVKKIQSGPTGRLSDDVNPDYVMAFQQLAHVDEILVLPKRLSITGNLISNGFQLMQKRGQAQDKFLKQLKHGEDAPFNYVPVKAMLIWNAIVNDFMRIRDEVGGNLEAYQVPPVHYYTYCYWDIAISVALGVDMSQEIVAWKKALSEEDLSIQKTVNEKIKPIRLRTKVIKVASLGNLLDVFSIQLFMKWLFRLSPVVDNPIDLLRWEEKNFPEHYSLATPKE